MKARFLTVFFVVAVMLSAYTSMGQTVNSVNQVVMADSVSSGNYKNALTSFYQFALGGLTGPNKGIAFNVNPFAIMLKNNPALSVDTSYYKYRAIRNLNFGFNIQLDSNYRFNGFASTIKYALINKRDETVSRSFVESAISNDSDFTKLNHALVKYGKERFKNDLAGKISFNRMINSLFNDSTQSFSKMDTSFQSIVKVIAEKNGLKSIDLFLKSNPDVVFYEQELQGYENLRAIFQNKHLLTIGASDTTYSDGYFRTLQFTTESIKGFLNPANAVNLEWDIKAAYVVGDDTAQISRNLQRQVFSFEPGVNLVIKNTSNQQSFIELKFSGSYNHVFRGLYNSEQQNYLLFSSILNVRISDNIWIPLQINYDPQNGNTFATLNLTANFTGLKTLLQSSSK